MKPEQQRIAIAKACGLPVVSDGITHYLTPCILGTGKYDPDGKGLTTVPDYLNDLNAMHEAEKLLQGEQAFDYPMTLVEVAGYKCHLIHAWCCRATAAQRAEAFLKTIGKWEGGES